jgi:hypothetical protein
MPWCWRKPHDFGAPYLQGPYFVSTTTPLSGQATLTDHYLYQNMSSVPSELVILWVQEFMQQSAQKNFWQKRQGPQAALKLRTAIATLAAGIDPAKKSITEWQNILSTLLFWKGK